MMNLNSESDQIEHQSVLPTELEIREEIENLRSTLLEGPKAPNIWAFYSHKNRKLITLVGDVTFIYAVLMEGDSEVRSYVVAPTPDDDESNGRNLLVEQVDGKYRWNLCGRYESLLKNPKLSIRKKIEAVRKHANKICESFEIITEKNFSNRMTEFWNILTLCATVTRALEQSIQLEHTILIDSLNRSPCLSIDSLLNNEGIDQSLMLAALSNALLKGYAHADLKSKQINRHLVICAKPQDEERINQNEIIEKLVGQENKTVPKLLPNNTRTAKIPVGWRDLSSWPEPNSQIINDPDKYRANKLAVEMYLYQRSDEDIFRESGVHEAWARKLCKKCIKQHPDGRIEGFRPLIYYVHQEKYIRKAPFPDSNTHRANTAGFAGAFGMLLRRFPNEIIKLIESEVLANYNIIKTKHPRFKLRASWTNLKDEFHRFLRKNGVSDNEYPFNTVDKGYGAISDLANSLLYCRPNQFINARSGIEAGRCLQIGNGASSLIRANAPFQIIEADFHKHDSASTVKILTPTHGEIFAPVPRFWVGCMVDTFNKAIIGASDSFEKQTTISCVLDLIDSAIAPPDPDKNIMYARVTSDGKWLANQIIPEFAYHGWDILKLDRAWAHYSYDVISGVVSTIGCAICFSKPRAWWSRSIIERSFLDLTKKGAQCLPTTTGSNPMDTKKKHPDETAIKLEFTRDNLCRISRTVIREINESGKQGAFWEAPIVSLRRSCELHNYFPRPVPLPRREDRPTLWVMIRAKVESNFNHGIRPSIRTHNCRFKGAVLSDCWDLSDQEVWLAISRRDINKAKVIDPFNGRLIDYVLPDKQWRGYKISWQNFCMIQKYGRRQSNDRRPPSSINDFKRLAQENIDDSEPNKICKESASALDRLNNIEEASGEENNASNSSRKDNCHQHPDQEVGLRLFDDVFGQPPDID